MLMRNHDVILSRRFLLLSFLLTTSLSFFTGYFSRLFLERKIKVLQDRVLPTSALQERVLPTSDVIENTENVIDTRFGPETSCSVNVVHDLKMKANDKLQMHRGSKGNHLLVEIGNANKAFLNITDKFSQTMYSILDQNNFNILSFHCDVSFYSHGFCLGLLSEGRISLHTLPEEGYLAIDFVGFTSDSIVQLVPEIAKAFAITLSHCSSPNGQPEISDAGVYQEALVQPGMFAHVEPKRVAILTNGNSAIIREVLKHSSVEEVKAFGIDNTTIEFTRNYIAPWQNCSDLPLSRESCFDDPRVELIDNEVKWFTNRFSYPCDSNRSENELFYCAHNLTSYKEMMIAEEMSFDVIILNFNLDAQVYLNQPLFESLYRALSKNGILVLAFGKAPEMKGSKEKMKYMKTMDLIKYLGFESIHLYEEPHADTRFAMSFVVACRSWQCRDNWHASEAEIQMMIHQRIYSTQSGSSSMKYFDGAVMKKYQIPPKIWEDIYCDIWKDSQCQTLRGFKFDLINIPADKFVIKTSSRGEKAGRGIFTAVDIPMGSLIMQEQALNKIIFSRRTIDRINAYINSLEPAYRLRSLHYFMEGYGFEQGIIMDDDFFVDSCFLMFMNHGCNGTNNVHMLHGSSNPTNTSDPYFSEATFAIEGLSPARRETMKFTSAHNIVIDRHLMQFVTMDVASRYINAGEELFSNYLLYSAAEGESFVEEVKELQSQCSGLNVGMITAKDSLK